MAVDTAAKRRYAAAVRGRLPWLRRFRIPYPDGTISQGDRQQEVGAYGGILAATVNIVVGPYRIAASQSHAPGSVAGQSHAPGSRTSQSHTPGSVAGQTY